MKRITKAILPVAGYGTRFLPATKAQPKEMLVLVDKPVIQYLVEEAVASGIKDIIFITGRNKRAIEDHFDYALELEHFLRSRGKEDFAKKVRAVSSLARFTYVRQGEPKGPGDALMQARHLIDNEAVAVLYGDDVVESRIPCLKQLISVFERTGSPVVALERVPKKDVSRYGVVKAKKIAQRLYKIERFVEKPRGGEAPSNLAVIGKYIYTPELFYMLGRMKPGPGGELYPTEIFDAFAEQGGTIYGYEYEGVRYDCGEKLGFAKAVVHASMIHPEIGAQFRRYLKEIRTR